MTAPAATPATSATGEPILEVRGLVKQFPVRSGVFGGGSERVHAVEGVDLAIPPGGTLGLVGESGSGKTTLGRCILRLEEPTAGSIRFLGRDLLALTPREMRRARQDLQVIFQDPYSSLNPRMRVGDIVGEPILIHKLASGRQERRERVAHLLETVGLDPAVMDRYPHEFSGGQRQRIGIARALSVQPKLIIADEPVSALDVAVQAQVINLLVDLQERFGIAYLFISHDLRIVEHVSDRVAVMYLGKIVEDAPAEELYRNPRHPYTRALLSAIPTPEPGSGRSRIVLAGEVPSPVNPPAGCAFHPRCPEVMDRCRSEGPELMPAGSGNHRSACFLVEEGPKTPEAD
ncbi:MAG: dipeptide ABC transporter ATP-binding protein [Acidobacteriota bacterium]|jgi:oligopeptide/dipeptide ABC transporter ATP-binding protein